MCIDEIRECPSVRQTRGLSNARIEMETKTGIGERQTAFPHREWPMSSEGGRGVNSIYATMDFADN